MNKTIIIRDKDFEDTADDIKIATNMCIIASLCLRVSYIVGEKHKDLSQIRKGVYQRARIYNDKIIPFAKVTINDIKEFCCSPGINGDSTYTVFKKYLRFLIEGADINMKLCDHILLFHETILEEFKTIQDETIKLKRKLGLDEKKENEFKEGKRKFMPSGKYNWAAGLALIPDEEVRSLILPILGKENEREQIPFLEYDSREIAAIDAMDPLTVSIDHYIKSLNKVSGFFSNLYMSLTTINEKIQNNFDDEAEYYYLQIKGKANEISESCSQYLGSIPECSTNITCIKEDYDESYVNEWIHKTIHKANLDDDFKYIKNKKPVLTRMLRVR